jgi:hypothetical protein
VGVLKKEASPFVKGITHRKLNKYGVLGDLIEKH